MAEMQRPNSIRRLMSLLSDQGLRDHASTTKPCTRDLKVMYASSVLCEAIAREARRTRQRLDVLNRSVLVSEVTYREARGRDASAI